MAEFARVCRQIEGIPLIELSSGCEPTLNPELIPMLELTRQRHPAAYINLTTNAMRLTDRLSSALIEHQIDKLLISLDAAEPAVYEEIRRGGKFSAVVENMRRCSALIRERGANRPALDVIFTLMADNAEQLPLVVELVASMGITSLIVNGLVAFSADAAGQALWGMAAAPRQAQEVGGGAARRGRELGVTVLFPDWRATPVRRCRDITPVIAWNGDVSPCFMCSFDRSAWLGGQRADFPRIALGNVHRAPLRAIWSSLPALWFRATRAAGLLPRYCRLCPLQMKVLCPYRTEWM